MKRGKYAKKRSVNARFVALVLVLTLSIGAVAGGTLAWLMDLTGPVVNTFTVGKVGATLTETKTVFKMIPGWTIDKDPVAGVTEGSEDSYLFVQITESANLKDYISYEIASGWTKLEDGVYYRVVKTVDTPRTFSVLKDDKVTVLSTVTEEMMEAIDGIDTDGNTDTDAAKAEIAARPALTFKAYATQFYKTNDVEFTPAEAWALVKPAQSSDNTSETTEPNTGELGGT